MKYFLLTLLALCFNLSLFSVSKLESDPDFIGFKSKLDSKWKITVKKELLLIERKEPVIVMPASQMNINSALSETENEKLIRMKKFGMKMKPNITYRFQKRWTVNNFISAETKREEIQSKIYSLSMKYKIEHLLDKDLYNKGVEIFTPTTKSEKKRIKDYFKEKSKLGKKFPLTPDYHFTKFSLFFISKKGVSNEYSEVYPESVMGEFIQIEKLLFKHKNKQ